MSQLGYFLAQLIAFQENGQLTMEIVLRIYSYCSSWSPCSASNYIELRAVNLIPFSSQIQQQHAVESLEEIINVQPHLNDTKFKTRFLLPR